MSVVLPAINTFVFDFSLVFVLNNMLHILYYHVLPNIFLYCLFIFVDYCSAARCGLWLSCRRGVAGTAEVHYSNHDFSSCPVLEERWKVWRGEESAQPHRCIFVCVCRSKIKMSLPEQPAKASSPYVTSSLRLW